MVFSRGCFMLFLNSLLLCIYAASFPDTGYPAIRNHDCCCFGNNLQRPEHNSVSWTPNPSKELNSFSRVQEAVTCVIAVMILLNIIVYKLNQLHKTSLERDEKRLPSVSPEHQCRRFLLSEMKAATNNFDQSMIIGKGGFGKVYRGVIDSGATMVAIKRLDSRSKQGASEFWTEIKMLSKVRHSNLVSLIGYCDEFDEMMVVYEHISGGNLQERLHKVNRSSQKHPLSWVERLKICIGAARALDYLHTGTGVHQSIIHRDVKSSNILLDEHITRGVSWIIEARCE